MNETRRELWTIGRLAAPVVATQLGTMMLWVIDVIMVGRVGVEAIDSVSLGRLWIMGTMIVGMGLVLGVDPLMAQAHGARDARLMGLTLQRGIVIAGITSIPVAVAWWVTGPVLTAAGQDPHLAGMAEGYVRVQLPLIPLYLAFTVVRQYLMGRGIVFPTMWVTFAGNIVNVVANWSLIFGHLGMPALGVVGAGIATCLTYAVMLALLVVWVVLGRLYHDAWTGWSRDALRPRGLSRILAFGTPVGVQLGLEMWAFMAATLVAGWLGTVQLASHTIVINLASISYMVPLGIAIGAVTRVGNLIGEGRPESAQRASWVAFAMGGAVMALFAIVFLAFRHRLPALYTDDPDVLASCAVLLPIAAAFQLFDGLQVVGGGVLRGMGKTRPAAVFNLAGYYGLALPLGWVLAFPAGMGLPGLWWGLCLGLGVVAVGLCLWVWRRGPSRVDARIAEL